MEWLLAGRWRSAILLIAVAAIPRAGFFLHSQSFFELSTPHYLELGSNLAGGLGFVSGGQPEILRTPGYPLFLACFERASLGPRFAVAAQHLLVVMMALALLLALWRRDRAVALAASMIAALDPASVYWANLVVSETLFSAAVLAAILLLRRHLDVSRADPPVEGSGRAGMMAGMLVGLAVMIRPVATYWAIPLAVVVCVRSRRAAPVVWFLVAALIVPSAWVLRNRVETGEVTLSSIDGINLLFWRGAGALAMESSGFTFNPLADGEQRYRDRLYRYEQPRLNRIADARWGSLSDAQRAGEFRRMGAQILRQHPRGAVASAANGALNLLFDAPLDLASVYASPLRELLLATMFLFTSALLLLSFVGLRSLFAAEPWFAWLLTVSVLYFVVVSAGPEADSRFRTPIAPLQAVAAGAGIVALARRRAH